jgi:hypothetical protein
MTSRSARLTGTIVSGSNEAFSARHPNTTRVPSFAELIDLHEV